VKQKSLFTISNSQVINLLWSFKFSLAREVNSLILDKELIKDCKSLIKGC